ncbi:hypothetical protein BaRGS_00025803 [Batillaria attramentaria]|uniref:Uncharacterized protein n=1 Tax=Batillaria attramentaria TaxID=370345 RepID=A0ABD0K7I2_9CAEN
MWKKGWVFDRKNGREGWDEERVVWEGGRGEARDEPTRAGLDPFAPKDNVRAIKSGLGGHKAPLAARCVTASQQKTQCRPFRRARAELAQPAAKMKRRCGICY